MKTFLFEEKTGCRCLLKCKRVVCAPEMNLAQNSGKTMQIFLTIRLVKSPHEKER